jgi:hypothetical protein
MAPAAAAAAEDFKRLASAGLSLLASERPEASGCAEATPAAAAAPAGRSTLADALDAGEACPTRRPDKAASLNTESRGRQADRQSASTCPSGNYAKLRCHTKRD